MQATQLLGGYNHALAIYASPELHQAVTSRSMRGTLILTSATLSLATACAVADQLPIAEFRLCGTDCAGSAGLGGSASAGTGGGGVNTGVAGKTETGDSGLGPAPDSGLDSGLIVGGSDGGPSVDAGLDAQAEIDAAPLGPECGDYAIPARTAWQLLASTCDDDCIDATDGAIDGDEETRFSTGADQDGGEWIQIDFGMLATFNQITLHSNDENDYPAAFEVRISDTADVADAEVLLAGVGTMADTVIELQTITAQYVRITQTGQKATWWSIHELNVLCN